MSLNDKQSRHASEAPQPPRCNCLALRQASRRITQFYDHALAPTGIRATQLSVLAWLHEHGPAPIHIIAEAMVMDRATLGHNLRPLEREGLVARTVGTDRRARPVVLTEAGKARLQQARDRWRHAQSQFEAAFGASDAAALRDALARVAALTFPST